MKVLQFGKYYFPYFGGIEKVNYLLTEGLNKRGIVCDVLCSNDKNKSVSEQINGYRVIRVKRYFEWLATPISPGLIVELYRVLEKGQYDFIHFHYPDPISNLALLLVRPKAKIVVHWHQDIIKQKLTYFFFKPLESWLLRKAAIVIVTSPNYLMDSKPLTKFRHKCFVVPLGIEDHKPTNAQEVSNLRDCYNEKKIIFALGRFTEYKGFEFLIRAATYLPSDHVILLAGGGPLRPTYEEIISKLNLSSKVILVGKVNDEELQSLYGACDVFCLPSVTKNEAFGLVLVEAMSYSKPIVATAIPGSGTSWVNQDNITGLNVVPGQPEQIATAILKITSDYDMKRKMGLNGRKRFAEMFTADLMVSNIVSIYNGLK